MATISTFHYFYYLSCSEIRTTVLERYKFGITLPSVNSGLCYHYFFELSVFLLPILAF